MRIHPLGDRVLIEPRREEKKKGGIILPDTIDKERPEQGIVIAVGPGKREKGTGVAQRTGKIGTGTLIVKKGDKVLFTKYGPNEIKLDDKEYLIAREEDILAIIE